jgi:hypothetical protein
VIEIIRIVEHQASLSSYRATRNEDRAVQLELLIELTKPKNIFTEWHPLIATPFRYNPPHPIARFRPRFGRNIFYASLETETALYEHAYHFMRQRMHLAVNTETGIRTLFSVDADKTSAVKIEIETLTSKQDYSASHDWIEKNPQISFILYPSCRDPLKRMNAAVLEIEHLGKDIKRESAIKFFYDNQQQKLTWIDYSLPIKWEQVM